MSNRVSLEELCKMLPGNPSPESVNEWLHEELPLSERAKYHPVEDCGTCMAEVRMNQAGGLADR